MANRCTPQSITDKCPNGQVNAGCVPYTGANLPNINVTSGMMLDEVLVNINVAQGGGSATPLRIVTIEIDADGTYGLPSGAWLLGIAVSPSSPLTAFKVGITPGGNEIIFDQYIPSGNFSTFNNSYYAGSSTTLYIGGITSATVINLLLI